MPESHSLHRAPRSSQAASLARRIFEEGTAEYHEQVWPHILTFFREAVRSSGAPFMEVLGSRAERVRQVIEALDAISLKRWTFTPPLAEMNKP